MCRNAGIVIFFVVVATTLGLTQTNCPEGFKYAGLLSGTGSAISALDEKKTLRLPENARLDQSFQQKAVRATNGKGGVRSSMSPQDVPKGLLIIPHGTSDAVYEQGWAVSNPELKAVEKDANGEVSRYEFGMRLMCKVGHTGVQVLAGDCSVEVEVCYKPLL